MTQTKKEQTLSDKIIHLKCPGCGLEKDSPLLEEDPPGAFIAEIMCPDCFAGGFGSTTYYDKNGNEIHEF